MISSNEFLQRVKALEGSGAKTLTGIRRGIEKESLRVDAEGHLSLKPHPLALGSALTHPYITTDYSEALLELVTPAEKGYGAPLQWLDRLHRVVYQALQPLGERVWNNSMPCPLDEDNRIPVAEYGTSNSGKMKHVYRLGLGHRYGRRMQTIAGIHYNFSFPTEFWQAYQQQLGNKQPLQHFISAEYFGLLRNFQRHSWVLLYLFGASPAICASFLDDRTHQLLKQEGGTLSRPYATSLRMSDLGYQNNAQSALQISLDDLTSYVNTLTYAISTSEPNYEQIGLCDGKGNYQQLNTSVLQIENEFYSSIRPKRVTQTNERPTLALERRGVEYIEIRSLDIDPFEPVGLNQTTCDFLDLFAAWCLLEPSEPLSHSEMNAVKQNIRQVAYDGRKPGLELWCCSHPLSLKQWGQQMVDAMQPLAELFDSAYGGNAYQQSLAVQQAKLNNPNLTPSAKVLEAVNKAHGFFAFAQEQTSNINRAYQSPPTDDDVAFFASKATESLQAQQVLEADKTLSFENYLANYFRGATERR